MGWGDVVVDEAMGEARVGAAVQELRFWSIICPTNKWIHRCHVRRAELLHSRRLHLP